jgi:predicted AAA+ superfamily ATPase
MYFERKIYRKLKDNVDNNKIIILTGSRQVGKTTLMKMLIEDIDKKYAFLDMDIVFNREHGETLEKFLDFLILNGYQDNDEKFYIFVDEFQKAPELASIFKNIYDHYPNIKIFASGSSSLLIKKNIKESLAGRKFIFEIYPLDFEEFLIFKQDKKILENYKNIQKLKSKDIDWPAKFEKLVDEYLRFGGYPEVVLSESEETKKMILTSIFDLYLEKDIMSFSGIENISAFKKLVEVLAVNNGQILNYNALSRLLGLHNKTVRSYIRLLEETYLIKTIKPYHTNKNKEIKKSPKIYFIDLGVRNYFVNNFNGINKRADKGQIWETYILGEFLKNNYKQIKFWRTRQGQEVDFIIEENGIIPLEVKYKTKGKHDDYANLVKFLDTYNLQKAYIVSDNRNELINRDDKEILFLTGFNFLKKLK